jgi:hypothetical protein
MSCSDTRLGSAGSLCRHSRVPMCVHAPRRTGLGTGRCAGYLQLRGTQVAGEWRKLHSEELHQMLLERSDEGG